MKLKAIFFDLDDTLENWWAVKELIKKKFCGIISKKYRISSEVFFKKFVEVEYDIVGNSLNPMAYSRYVWLKETFRRLKLKATEKELKDYEKLYWKIAYPKIKPYPDTLSTLQRLKGYKKAIITDSDGDLNDEVKNKKINLIGVRKYFDAIITSNQTGKNKPDKKLWKVALKKLKLNPKECMMVGDKPEMDLKPAKEMGFMTAWIKKGHWASLRKGKKFNYVDYEIDKISELLRIINEKQN